MSPRIHSRLHLVQYLPGTSSHARRGGLELSTRVGTDLITPDPVSNNPSKNSSFECYSNWPGWGTQTVSGARISTPLVGIRWASSDLSRLQTHPLTPGLVLAGVTSNSGSSGSSTSSSTSISTTHATTPIPIPKPSSGLSGGTIAGAVVGAVVGILILAVVFVLLFIRRRRRRRTEDASPAVNLGTDGNAKPELHGDSKAPTNSTAVELNTDIEAQPPVELPADSSPISVAHSRGVATHISLLQPLSSFVDRDDSPAAQRPPEAVPASPQSTIPAGVASNPAVPPTSTSEQAGTTNKSPATNQAEVELAQLRRKQAEIAERRERLLQLEQLAEEERRIQQRIDQLGEQSSSSPHQ